jgi:cytidine deaminase
MSLFDQACAVRENAHAPYSGFRVGAAVRTPDGRVFTGCNVENAAYPEGLCAEAGAIAAMVAAGARKIAEILVVADADEPVPPCGGCRQKIVEFAAPDVTVTLARSDGSTVRTTVGALLPGAFTTGHLG